MTPQVASNEIVCLYIFAAQELDTTFVVPDWSVAREGPIEDSRIAIWLIITFILRRRVFVELSMT